MDLGNVLGAEKFNTKKRVLLDLTLFVLFVKFYKFQRKF